jgi:bifunctional UDP-N-acetylglucosamine pyrophosphorylase/glucosamine-1-phosphate N-acetyltransferase
MAVKAIVLGAGKGTRMKSDLAKVLHPVAGRPMLLWTLDIIAALDPAATVVVVGHQAEAVRDILPHGVDSALQTEQLGTGHATMVALPVLDVDADDDIVVMPGDMPLVTGRTLVRMLELHRASGAAATLLSVELDEPGAYGRVVRDGSRVLGIVEAKDATPEQLEITEVGTSVYVFCGRWLADALARVGTGNVQGEYYLTDVIGILVGDGHRVEALRTAPEEGLGINSIDQIARVESVLKRRNDIT